MCVCVCVCAQTLASLHYATHLHTYENVCVSMYAHFNTFLLPLLFASTVDLVARLNSFLCTMAKRTPTHTPRHTYICICKYAVFHNA